MSWLKHIVSFEPLGAAGPQETNGEVPAAVQPHRFDWRWAGALLAVAAVAWLAAALFVPVFQIGRAEVPVRAGDQQLTALIAKQAAAYRLTVQYPDQSQKRYSLAEVGLRLDPSATIKEARRQTGWWQRLAWWQPRPVELRFKRDEPALNRFLTAHINLTIQPSQDANLSLINGEIKLTDAVTGKQYGLIHPKTTLSQAAASLSLVPVKVQTLAVNPALTAAVLEPYKASLARTLAQPIRFTVGAKTVTPATGDVANWLEITPDSKTKRVDITVNSGKVQAYINRIAAALIHPARAQVEVADDAGGRRVLVPGVMGVDVPNKSGVASSIARNLLKGEGMNIDLPVSRQAFQTITAGNYAKWIEVDTTNKRLYAYQYGDLVKEEPISAGAPETPTVTGQYAIYVKYDQQDMRGNNVDGSRYFQPHVRWISYFYKDYAIHGNYWRPLSYFGNVNSSHGCVSMPDSNAEWMYSWAPVGTPVIVHT